MAQSLKQAATLIALDLIPLIEAGEIINIGDFTEHFEASIEVLYNDGVISEAHYHDLDYDPILDTLSCYGWEII